MRADLLDMFTQACAVSNTGRPLTDNKIGNAVAEIEALRNVEVHAGLLIYHLKDTKLSSEALQALTELERTLNKVKVLE